MQPSQLTAHRRLDELVLEALAAHMKQLPVTRPADSGVSIEVMTDAFADDELSADDVAVTSRFVRVSQPYEAVEIEAVPSLAALRVHRRPTTFARTVRMRTAEPSETLSFDKVWFEQPDDTIAAIEDVPAEPRRSWWWLVASVVAAAGVVAALALY